MLKVIIVGGFVLIFLYSGVVNLSDAIRFRPPPVTTLAETPAAALPTFVTLKDISFDTEHLLKLKYGSEVLFIPIRAKGAAPDSKYPVMIQTSAPELIAAVGSQSPDALTRIAELAARTEVTGRAFPANAKEIASFRQQLPLVSDNLILIGDGSTPGLIQGIVMLTLGLGLGTIALAGGFKKATPPAAPPVAKT